MKFTFCYYFQVCSIADINKITTLVLKDGSECSHGNRELGVASQVFTEFVR